MRFRGALFVPLVVTACATTLPHAESSRANALRPTATPLPLDPTVRDVRFVPVAAREDRAFGEEPGGGLRTIEDGIRVVTLPGGAVLTSDDRLPMALDSPLVVALPERLGGGFLFVVDSLHVWRADGWLEPARPVFTSRTSFLDTYGRMAGGLVAGLDRVYAFTGTTIRTWQAFDGTTGKDLPQGPWPVSPAVSAFAAIDGWRALAIADLRGLVATFDAGATFRPVRLPIDPREIRVAGDAFEVRGTDASGNEVRYEVRADGQAERISDAFERAMAREGSTSRDPPGPLGPNPLAAAVEDGWPMGDGTAIVARDGVLARVRLDDGSVAEMAPGAYDLRPSRCHPIALGAPGGVGFACGESRGATVLYAFDPSRGHMDEVRRFETPRAVLASGNGALAVRGPCDPSGRDDETERTHAYCVRPRDGTWREVRLEGAVGGERVVVLGDGRVAIVSPPQGSLAAARLTMLQGEHSVTRPIDLTAFARLSPDLLRVLDVGVWLDGFEERRPGILGGWIEAAGTMLGVEIDLEGRARFGQYVRDAGKTMVSGRYALGWTPSLLGLESTDGGMTWTQLDVPAPIAVGRAVASRSCGPVGCAASGWLRIGWGRPTLEPHVPPPTHASAPRSVLVLSLACDAVPDKTKGIPVDPVTVAPAPSITPDEELLTNDSFGARVLAWGPKGGDWEHTGKWAIRWAWPFGGVADARSTIPSPVPSLLASAARFGVARTLKWSLLPGDDASHALLATHRKHDETSLFELDADHAPQEIERADGEPFGEIDAALRAAGRWYIVSPPNAGGHPGGGSEATVWQVDGTVARELARIPRASDRAHASLAFRSDGKAIGLVTLGAPGAWPTRWILPIDLETGSPGDAEAFGPHDFGDRTSLSVCTHDDTGWLLDVPAAFPIRFARQGVPEAREASTLANAIARVRLSSSRVCVERLAGTLDVPAGEPAVTHAASAGASLSVALTTSVGHERRVFRCSER